MGVKINRVKAPSGDAAPKKADTPVVEEKPKKKHHTQVGKHHNAGKMIAKDTVAVPTRNQVKRKTTYVESKIPGVEPEKVGKTGKCVYSKEQLAEVRMSLPNPEVLSESERAAQYAIREKQVAQVELLMLKGVTNLNILAGIMQCSRQHCAGLMLAVKTRWEVLGGPRNASSIKGEAAAKLSLLENEYWTLFSKDSTTATTKVGILSNLVNLIDRKLLLHGLSPRILEVIAQDAPGASEVTAETPMNTSLAIKESLAQATREAVQLIAKAGRIYDVTPE